MRVLFVVAAAAAVLSAQGDPALQAYRTWEATQHGVDYRTRAQHLLEVSAEWVSKWPDSDFVWRERRESLVSVRSASVELWKQVNENIIRLSPPHTFAGAAASDWVTMGVNVEAAEKLLLDEIAWEDSRPRPALTANATLADLVDDAGFTDRLFVLLCTLARAQIRLKQFDEAQATVERVHSWLDGDFRRHYDTDPLEAFPDYGVKYFQLSAELAVAQGRKADALAFYHAYLADPYFRREYGAPSEMNPPKSLWKEIGGTDAGWAAYSAVPPLPPGVPVGGRGARFPAWANVVYFPWVKVDYKLPPMQIADLVGRTWANRDFVGKATNRLFVGFVVRAMLAGPKCSADPWRSRQRTTGRAACDAERGRGRREAGGIYEAERLHFPGTGEQVLRANRSASIHIGAVLDCRWRWEGAAAAD